LNLELTRPGFLLWFAVVLPFLLLFFARSLNSFSRQQQIVSVITRGCILLCILLSLGGLTWLHESSDRSVVFLVDRSASIGAEANAVIEQTIQTAKKHRGRHRMQLVEFDLRARVLQSGVVADNTLPANPEPTRPLHKQGTNIAAAIRTAEGCMPVGFVPGIVLLSEGNETHGDASSAAMQSDIPIDVIPLPARTEPEVQLSDVIVPDEVRQGEPFNVDVVIYSNHDDVALIEVFRGDHRVVGQKQRLTAGENRFRFPQTIDQERLASFSARVSGSQADTLLDNNTRTGLVYTSGRPRILIIADKPTEIRDLAYGLEEQGILADVRPAPGMPQTMEDLQNYELLMLSNVPATEFSQEQMELTRTYVKELGGGFIMLGGDQSFGLGGYHRSTLEEILPVRSDFEKEKEKPSLALVLIIDKSGSMDGQKIEMAKSAARSAVELLGPRDHVAVLAFEDRSLVISEMQTASSGRQIESEISRLNAEGGTVMYPSMETAHEMLQATPAKLKHVILLTDGVSSPGDFAGITQTMAASRITVSTVAVGADAGTQLLEEIARLGKGRYYFTEDPSQVPQIFAKETVTAGKSAIDEAPFLPQLIRATHALNDIDMSEAPFLFGYVVTQAKPTSEVILATEAGDPLLAWWRYGLGISACFTSDATKRWAAEWMTWPEFSKFWTHVIRHVMRKNDTQGISVSTEQHDGILSVDVDIIDDDGGFLNKADVGLTVIAPDLNQAQQTLQQSAPGRYHTEFPTDQPGAYHLEVAVYQDSRILYRQSRGIVVGYSEELRIRPANEPLLQAVADSSGGRFNPDAAQLFDDDRRRATHYTELWPYLLSAAMILLVLDIALRRIDFSIHQPFARWMQS
jgi:Ca-activated chloride channel family protein